MDTNLPYTVNDPDVDFPVVNDQFVRDFVREVGVTEPLSRSQLRHEGDGSVTASIGANQSVVFQIEPPMIYAVHDWRNMGIGGHLEVDVTDPDGAAKVKEHLAEANA